MTVFSLAVFGILWALTGAVNSPAVKVAFLLSQVVVISIIIWQACNPFADAAQWIGTAFKLPGSVRGATLDAVASSMPELFTGIFFVIVAVFGSTGSNDVAARRAAEGYGATVATCAGSAVYNMILIPAFCALVISFKRKQRPTIDIEPEVITRDGLWFVGCEIALIIFLFQPAMHWWMGVTFLAAYVVYVCTLYAHARRHRRSIKAVEAHLAVVGNPKDPDQIIDYFGKQGIKVSADMVEKARKVGDADKDDDSAGFLFGLVNVPLNHLTVWIVVALSTAASALVCYWLVEVTFDMADAFGVLAGRKVPVFFVAVILVAAASSVPDTFLAIGAARRGDDSGAVSNAFGSNIFDICISLSIPLLVCSYLDGWQPVSLTMEDGKPMQGLVDLRVLLVTLTTITLLIMWHKRQLTRRKALVLCCLYAAFVAYAVVGSLGITIF
ncbi:MAG: hypothetical protein IH991_17800 [Planctomycetes bacterium]|nr:hypothetical protein [Planctomycetota bacterium]